MSNFEKKYKSTIGPDGSIIMVDENGLRVDKYGHKSYYSQENDVWVSAEFLDSPTYCEEHGLAVFYDEEAEEKYKGFFDYNDNEIEQLESQNVKKKIYPN